LVLAVPGFGTDRIISELAARVLKSAGSAPLMWIIHISEESVQKNFRTAASRSQGLVRAFMGRLQAGTEIFTSGLIDGYSA
jgi:hypothetical protein